MNANRLIKRLEFTSKAICEINIDNMMLLDYGQPMTDNYRLLISKMDKPEPEHLCHCSGLIERSVKIIIGEYNDYEKAEKINPTTILKTNIFPYPICYFELSNTQDNNTIHTSVVINATHQHDGFIYGFIMPDSNRNETTPIIVRAFSISPKQEMILYDTIPEFQTEQGDDAYPHIIIFILKILSLLNSKQIEESGILYSSSKIQRNRKKRGKPPLFSYKVLKISTDK